MRKRDKRLTDYARFKAIKDRGDKPDKKTFDQGEQFVAVNDTLKEELPKLFALTGKLVEACLNNFVQLQLQWQVIWRRKLSQAIDENDLPGQISDIIESFSGDFAFVEAQALSLSICNGSMLADAVNLVNFLSPTTTLNGDESPTPRRPSTMNSSRNRGISLSNDASPVLPQPDFGARESGSFSFPPLGQNQASGAQYGSNQASSNRRVRANSAASGPGLATPEMPGSFRSFSNTPPSTNILMRPSTSTGRSSGTSPILPRLDVDTPSFNRLSRDSPSVVRPPSGSTYFSATQDTQHRSSSPSARYSGLFSSAMPMSDSPRPQSPAEVVAQGNFNVLFLAASVYEFNIDRARREAGYPYLTYVAGEVS